MVTPRLMGLFAYLERGAALTYRRSLNISLFETIIISQLGDVVEMPLSELIGNIDRNKGQVGRTIKSLEDNGWVEYSPISTSRRAVLRLTQAGRGMARQMVRIAIERDEALMEGVSADERETFAQVLTELTANAARRLHSLQGNSG
jgi:DNA-binding MarR family transcriptional regulator